MLLLSKGSTGVRNGVDLVPLACEDGSSLFIEKV